MKTNLEKSTTSLSIEELKMTNGGYLMVGIAFAVALGGYLAFTFDISKDLGKIMYNEEHGG